MVCNGSSLITVSDKQFGKPFLFCYLTVLPFLLDNQCVQSCEDGTYGDFGMQECLQCFPSCRTCTGPFSTDCLSCPTDLNIKFGSCVSNCESRTYLDTSKSLFHSLIW